MALDPVVMFFIAGFTISLMKVDFKLPSVINDDLASQIFHYVVNDDDFFAGKFDTSFLDTRVDEFALLHALAPAGSESKGVKSFFSKLMQKGLVSNKGDFI